MKRTFLTTAALILCASAATAEVTVSGDGRLGIKYVEDRVQQSSRARVKFKMKQETSNGIEFGAEIRADQASKGKDGAAGHVYASGNFGKIRFGNNDGASYMANGELHNIFLEGNDDEDFLFFSTAAVDVKNPNILYEFTTGNTTLYASLMDGDADDKEPKDYEDAKAVGVKYDNDRFTLGLGVEQGTSYDRDADGKLINHAEDKEKETLYQQIDNVRATVSGELKFDSYKIKALFSTGEKGDEKVHQYGGSGEYTNGDLKLAAFVKQQKEEAKNINFGGFGASYDLNEHAAIKGGIAVKKDGKETSEYADLGITLKF